MNLVWVDEETGEQLEVSMAAEPEFISCLLEEGFQTCPGDAAQGPLCGGPREPRDQDGHQDQEAHRGHPDGDGGTAAA